MLLALLNTLFTIRSKLPALKCYSNMFFKLRKGASITRFVGRSVGLSVRRKNCNCLKMASLDNHMKIKVVSIVARTLKTLFPYPIKEIQTYRDKRNII